MKKQKYQKNTISIEEEKNDKFSQNLSQHLNLLSFETSSGGWLGDKRS